VSAFVGKGKDSMAGLECVWECNRSIPIHRKSLPFPKVIHKWSTFKSSNTATPITTTSVSELTMLIYLLPPIPACVACRNKWNWCIRRICCHHVRSVQQYQ
jgi:hypothetical protein